MSRVYLIGPAKVKTGAATRTQLKQDERMLIPNENFKKRRVTRANTENEVKEQGKSERALPKGGKKKETRKGWKKPKAGGEILLLSSGLLYIFTPINKYPGYVAIRTELARGGRHPSQSR